MWDVKACIVCFSKDITLFDMDSGQLRVQYNLLSGLKTDQCFGMPQYLCLECAAYVRRFMKFRQKCQRAYYALKEILDKNKEIRPTHLETIDRKLLGLTPTLTFLDPKKCHHEEVKFQWMKYSRINVLKKTNMPVIQKTTLNNDMIFDTSKKENNITVEVPPLNVELEVEYVKEENDAINSNLNITFDDLNYVCKDQNESEPYNENNDNVNEVVANDLSNVESLFDNDNFNSDNEFENTQSYKIDKTEDPADGCNLEEEYASMIPVSVNEAKAVVEIYKMFSHGKYRCKICSKGYNTENRLTVHLRMHDKHVSGTFLCELCNYYYKTEFLLKTHMTEKHMYKYVCKKCPEVNFDRISAKQHYIWTHLQKGHKKDANWYDSRPSWLSPKGGKRVKGVVSLKPVRKVKKLPEDFPVYSPIGHEEQYIMVSQRKNTRNYIDAKYRCELCFRGFREMETYSKHMRKHDPEFAGPFQCDMCKLQFTDTRRMYKHMNITHLFKYTCQLCSYVCTNRGQAQIHYRWHKNVTYQCPHCKKEFKKASTRLTHIRIKHPSTYICNMCGHSYVSETGLYCHKKLVHSKHEIAASDAMSASADTSHALYCAECRMQFFSETAYTTHLGSSNKHSSTNLSIKPVKPGSGLRRKVGRPSRANSEVLNNGVAIASSCDLCGKHLSNDVATRRHYAAAHPEAEFPKRYMCDVCGHITKQYANLMVHMRTHTNEKPYGCPHCDRRFSMPSNRDRHLVVHTGEKRYQCQHCNRRFTQSSAVKLHIQTVHLKIPYAPWDKKNRKRRKEQESYGAPLATVNTTSFLQQPPKLVLDSAGDYLNAFITYNDE